MTYGNFSQARIVTATFVSPPRPSRQFRFHDRPIFFPPIFREETNSWDHGGYFTDGDRENDRRRVFE